MENDRILLETKIVKDISGTFYVPSYQRGYRWGRDEVLRLLNDIYLNGRRNYCLQPVVVRKNGDRYELIDGQQRLTTIYLIYRYMHELNPAYYDEPAFTITYGTRQRSQEFLSAMDLQRRNENIDFWFMSNAYETIRAWFEEERRNRDRAISECFDNYVRVIWYEVGEQEDAISLFTRLNIGKIPLTSAELVKALFLSRSSGKMDRGRQEEIALQWDDIEKELHSEALWSFLTNDTGARYQTRIDLILDLVSGKPDNNREAYYTFFKIDEIGQTMPMEDVWRMIRRTFLILKDWFEDHELYHKIGYLIASKSATLQRIYRSAAGATKRAFREGLDGEIRKSVEIRGNYADLTYEKDQDRAAISRLLLLFNVESVRQAGNGTQRFPFDKFKVRGGSKSAWSLEHIHAQHSQGLRTQAEWKEWLGLHIHSVKVITGDEALIRDMEDAVNRETISGSEFEELRLRVEEQLSAKGSGEYLHSIGNLALLRTDDNAALNNSTFDVKRNKILEMDKEGQYIPFCTRMVFLKYYAPSEGNSLYFWGHADREAYIGAINRVLGRYLSEPIEIGGEAE